MLELSGITAAYGETTVLRDVTLTVPPASVVALLGPNGAGKTTLLRVASGLLVPQRGRILWDGADVTGQPPNRLVDAGICHVPEGRAVFPNLTVRENLQLFLRAGQGVADIDGVVEALPRLGERINQVAGTMSGGEQQMLALARAYLRRPQVVLLDEVSMGLAPKIVDDIFAFLRRLAEAGSALLLVEQYVTKALQFADYVFVLNRGRVAFAGEPGEFGADDDIFAHYLGTEFETSSV